MEYELAFHYALDTYARRDVAYVMGKIHGKKEGSGDSGGTTIIVPQQEIEQWVKEQYEDEEEE